MSNNITDEEIIMLMNEININNNDSIKYNDYEPNEDELNEINYNELQEFDNIITSSK